MPLKTLGLTGGVGMGKTTAHRLLEASGLPVVDTDQLARKIVEPGQPALKHISETFGAHLVDSEGQLRRTELAALVFRDPAARLKLEQILHPPIRELWRNQVQRWDDEGKQLAVVVIPLLFETSAERELDQTICLACSLVTQRHRLRERGWSDVEIDQRNQAQWPIEKKIVSADYLVWNEGPLEVTKAQLDRILKSIG